MPKPVYGRTPGPPDPAPESDVSDLDPRAPESLTVAEPAVDPNAILIHVVEDGFSTNSRVWYRGQELEFLPGSAQYEATQDRNGASWLDFTEREQMRAWGRVMFRPGPWPGDAYDVAVAARAEQERSRIPPTLPPLPIPPRVST